MYLLPFYFNNHRGGMWAINNYLRVRDNREVKGRGSFQIKISYHFNISVPKWKWICFGPYGQLAPHSSSGAEDTHIFFNLDEYGGGKSHDKDKHSQTYNYQAWNPAAERDCRDRLPRFAPRYHLKLQNLQHLFTASVIECLTRSPVAKWLEGFIYLTP